MTQSNITPFPSAEARPTLSVPRPRPEFRPDQARPDQARPEQPRKKFVAKGHDSQLQDAQYGKFPVEVTTMGDGTVIHGLITRRDKFTITLRITRGTDEGKELIVYKHAIESVLINKAVAPAANGSEA